MAGAGVNEAGGDFADEDLVQTRLVTADAGVDLIRTTALRFGEQFGIREERTRHRDHIGVAAEITSSATCGSLMRFVVTSGTETLPFSLRVTQLNAARGTGVAMVGMRASCQPIPVLIMVAPAASIACASCTVSSKVPPPSTRSSIDRRKMIIKSAPARSRTARTTSTAKRMRRA